MLLVTLKRGFHSRKWGHRAFTRRAVYRFAFDMELPPFKGTPFPPCPENFEDHVYKDELGVKIPLRIWRAEGQARNAPWILWIHGGGWYAGKYTAPNAWVVPGFTERGYHVVSIAYRFIPQAALPDIIADCTDAFAWCQRHLPSLFGSDIDVNRYVIAGDSAGGHLATLLSFDLTPRPSAVVAVYAAVDLYGLLPKWHTIPAEESSPPEYLATRTEKELKAAAIDHNLAHADVFCPWDGDLPPNITLEKLRSFLGVPDYQVNDSHTFRLDVNKYLISRNFDRIACLLRRDDYVDLESYEEAVKKASPLYRLDSVTTYPPTFFLHGVLDNLVPLDQATKMSTKLGKLGVPTCHGFDQTGGHCFDIFISGPGDEGWAEMIVPALDFVDQHIKSGKR